ncbi:MAG TPA: CbtB-domain containing protein, partial [Chloroflexota bacterium]|nr:CbtB-domain containing protein [Chloroflexota bacterium]
PWGGQTRTLIGAAILAALGIYLLVVDQGLALSLVQGNLAFDQNLLHELLHDGRHALGVPCH